MTVWTIWEGMASRQGAAEWRLLKRWSSTLGGGEADRLPSTGLKMTKMVTLERKMTRRLPSTGVKMTKMTTKWG